jgi:type II secretory pathway component GspD/PulD (secretin)
MRKAAFGWAVAGAVLALAGAESTAGAAGQKREAPPAAQAKGGAAAKGPAKPAAAQAMAVKAFELSHAQPEMVRQTVTSSWSQFMQLRGHKGNAAPPRIVVDPRTRTLFARGTEQELEGVGELIGLLDAAPGKEPTESKGLQVVRLKHAKASEVLQVLAGLGLQSQAMALPRTNTLLLAGEGMSEAHSVIEKLDVETKQEATKEPKKETKPTPKGAKAPAPARR